MFRFAQHDKTRSVEPPRVLNVEDLRRAAKRRLPRVVFDYIDGGAEDERTLRANCHAFEEVTFRPRCAVATPACDLRVSVLDRPLSMPLILAPVGSSRLMYPRGEEAAASAAGAAGIAYALSTLSGCRLEDVADASKGPLWYQLYLVRSEEHTSELQSQSNLVCRLLLEKKKYLLPRRPDVARRYDPGAVVQLHHRSVRPITESGILGALFLLPHPSKVHCVPLAQQSLAS